MLSARQVTGVLTSVQASSQSSIRLTDSTKCGRQKLALVGTGYPQSLESAQEIQVLSESAELSKSDCSEGGTDTGKYQSQQLKGC